MSGLGSVFLGDRTHHFPKLHSLQHASQSPPASPSPKAVKVDPILALQLRIRWLESLVHGSDAENVSMGSKPGEKHVGFQGKSLTEGILQLRKSLEEEVSKRDEFKKFYKNYDKHATFLGSNLAVTPIPNATSSAPTYDSIDQTDLEALLAELEPDLRAADRDLREIEMLENRGVTAAGKLPEHEHLKERLGALEKAAEEDMHLYASLEERITSILESYATHVDALSELFVSWNDIVTEAEDTVAEMEREKALAQRLVFEA